MGRRYYGQSVPRREDRRFITGKGQYLDNLPVPGALHLVLVRCPYAHARIRGIDTSKAKAAPGVAAIFTGDDLTGVNGLP